MRYYDLPRKQIQVSEEEALFDRLMDDRYELAEWLTDCQRAGFSLRECRGMIRSARSSPKGV